MDQESQDMPPTPKKKGRVSALLDDCFKDDSSNSTARSAEEISQTEIKKYFAEDKLELDKNPLEWCAQRKMLFHILHKIDQKNNFVV